MKTEKKKCAIYTRKSTDKGLEQDFNTLDAQRESCLAYIASQKSEGWIAEKKNYDDGGYSGGSLERPALQQLLEDIKTGKINIVVVYKIDRLTRSLADFAKLVEVFDQYGVSFVSVTQSFNTTTSMGRLTLNVLLSFAQFEREVIGERIRDKVAASKKKGMWMGGNPMLGYDIKDRQLVINESEAKVVRYIYGRYLELGSIRRLKEDLEQEGIKSKSWISQAGREHTGQSHSHGALYYLLSNPVYAGLIRHKGEVHEGMHKPIIPRDEWQHVQETLIEKARTNRGHKNQSVENILKGRIFDAEGTLYTPMRAHKKEKQYRYYVSQNIVQNRNHPKNVIGRLPAYEIEMLILNAITSEIADVHKLSAMSGVDLELHYRVLEHVSKSAHTIPDIDIIINRVVVHTGSIAVEVCVRKLTDLINKELDIVLPIAEGLMSHTLTVPYHTKRAGKGAVIIRSGDGKDPLDLPKNQLETLVKGIIWRDEHFRGKSFIQIAQENACSRSLVLQTIYKTFEIA